MAPPRRPNIPATATLAALVLIAGGCGEKSEPDLSQLPPPPGPPVPTPPQGLPPDVAGRWQGTLRQADTRPFPIAVTIASASNPARNPVRYGGEIDCSGTWSYLGADGPSVRFRETIDSGARGRCKGSGAVTVTVAGQAGERLGYRFSGDGVVSRGTLTRR